MGSSPTVLANRGSSVDRARLIEKQTALLFERRRQNPLWFCALISQVEGSNPSHGTAKKLRRAEMVDIGTIEDTRVRIDSLNKGDEIQYHNMRGRIIEITGPCVFVATGDGKKLSVPSYAKVILLKKQSK